jgi:hypothetical protein
MKKVSDANANNLRFLHFSHSGVSVTLLDFKSLLLIKEILLIIMTHSLKHTGLLIKDVGLGCLM